MKPGTLFRFEKSIFQFSQDNPILKDDSIAENEPFLTIEWGHKHLGYAKVGNKTVLPRRLDYVVCKLISFEIVHQAMGHEVFERHNQARLEVRK